MRHFLDIDGLDKGTLRAILDSAHAMKSAGRRLPGALRPKAADGAVLIAIFEKASTRTRVSFDLAMRQLGGETIVLNEKDLGLGHRETIADTARVLSRYADVLVLRAVQHKTLLELAEHASVPVINGLTNMSHPCQIMADLQTLEEAKGPLGALTVAWIGDANNVMRSWVHAAARFGFALRVACPAAYGPGAELMAFAKREGARLSVTADPTAAAAGADCLVTDTWVSIGDSDGEARQQALAPYQVDAGLMRRAAADAIFLHCLPAHRGQEVSAEVIDGPQSRVWDEAENRLHAQKAILAWCLGSGP